MPTENNPFLVDNDIITDDNEYNVINDKQTTQQPIDENDICINDRKSPIILLFGPPACGKSMIIVRLARYLRTNGYQVIPDIQFKSDQAYQERCESFNDMINTQNALNATKLNEFLLIRIIKDGRTVCQILEAPGEHYFDPNDPQKTSGGKFQPYLTEMIHQLPNRKIWAFITEANWKKHANIKQQYVQRIQSCKNILFKKDDNAVIIHNKIDTNEHLYKDGAIFVTSAEKEMKDEFGGLADIFKNPNPITSIWRPFNYKYVPFSTGIYTKNVDGSQTYNESNDIFPRRLWDVLKKCITG